MNHDYVNVTGVADPGVRQRPTRVEPRHPAAISSMPQLERMTESRSRMQMMGIPWSRSTASIHMSCNNYQAPVRFPFPTLREDSAWNGQLTRAGYKRPFDNQRAHRNGVLDVTVAFVDQHIDASRALADHNYCDNSEMLDVHDSIETCSQAPSTSDSSSDERTDSQEVNCANSDDMVIGNNHQSHNESVAPEEYKNSSAARTHHDYLDNRGARQVASASLPRTDFNMDYCATDNRSEQANYADLSPRVFTTPSWILAEAVNRNNEGSGSGGFTASCDVPIPSAYRNRESEDLHPSVNSDPVVHSDGGQTVSGSELSVHPSAVRVTEYRKLAQLNSVFMRDQLRKARRGDRVALEEFTKFLEKIKEEVQEETPLEEPGAKSKSPRGNDFYPIV